MQDINSKQDLVNLCGGIDPNSLSYRAGRNLRLFLDDPSGYASAHFNNLYDWITGG